VIVLAVPSAVKISVKETALVPVGTFVIDNEVMLALRLTVNVLPFWILSVSAPALMVGDVFVSEYP
jgi:hypothetical protein